MAMPRRREAALRALVASALAAVAAGLVRAEPCGRFPTSGFDGPDMRRVEGRYSNGQYHYAVDVPAGHAAYLDPDAPDHGVGIVLSWEPRAYVNVDGTYDAVEWKTPAAAAKQLLAWKRDSSTSVLSHAQSPARLGPLRALRQVVRHRCAGRPDVYVDDDIVAIADGVVYELSLTTTEARYPQDKALIDRMRASWRLGGGPAAGKER